MLSFRLPKPIYEVCLVAALLFVTTSLAAAADDVAEVVSVQGQGEYRVASNPWQAAYLDLGLQVGNEVRTGEVSRMGLLFADRTQLRLHENTTLRIKAPSREAGETLLQLDRGRVWTRAKGLPEGLRIETPAVTAAIRGTAWELDVDDKGRTLITVLSGQVDFYNPYGRLLVSANEQAVAEVGKAPTRLFLARPEDRVQWVTAFQLEPLRYIVLPALWDDQDERSLAAVYARLADGEHESASKILKQITPAAAERFYHTYAAAAVAVQQGRLPEATKQLNGLLQKRPLQPAPYLLLAELQAYLGESGQAYATLARGSEQFPGEPAIPALAGNIALLHGDADKAREYLEQVKRTEGGTGLETELLAGSLARYLGEGSSARGAYRSATRIAPQDDRGWYGLGVVENEREDVGPARTALQKALSLEPAGPGYQGELGTLETFASRYEPARRAFDKALEDHPEDYVALTGLGVLQLKQGQPREALARFLRANVIEPRYARAHLYAGVAYYQLGQHKAAIQELERAAELDQRDPLPHVLLSMVHNDYFEAGDAIESGRKGLARMPYLKSLNQVANNQQGTANLGRAFAFFGMEEWAMYHAQEGYYPYWAGSHLFLADRYPGLFNRTSELYQGFLTDPTVFGASNRFQNLVTRPGAYLSGGYRYGYSEELSASMPYLQLNGLDQHLLPLAWFLNAEPTRIEPDNKEDGLETELNTFTAALGARVNHDLGIFLFGNVKESDDNFSGTTDGVSFAINDISTTSRRFDLGGYYLFGPQNQVWLKYGVNDGEEDFKDGDLGGTLVSFNDDKEGADIALRHSWRLGDAFELSWGVESGYQEQFPALSSPFLFGGDLVSRQKIEDESLDVYASLQLTPVDGLLLQGDLYYQEHERSGAFEQLWVEPPFPDVVVTGEFENFDHDEFNPRAGVAWTFADNRVLRLAYQRWRRPALPATLAPLATVGIPVDDELVQSGGFQERLAARLESAWGTKTFTALYADYLEVENEPFANGNFRLTPDVEELDRLKGRNLASLSTIRLLEASPEFAKGEVTRAGVGLNQVLSSQLSAFARYQYCTSENTGAGYKDNDLPYMPENTVATGFTWVSPWKIYLITKATYRSDRFSDEANADPIDANWDGSGDLFWESRDKHFLVRVGVDNLWDDTVKTFYSFDANLRF